MTSARIIDAPPDLASILLIASIDLD